MPSSYTPDSVNKFLEQSSLRALQKVRGRLSKADQVRSREKARPEKSEADRKVDYLLTIEKMKALFTMGNSGGRVVDYADGAKEYVPNLPDGTPQATTGNVFYDPNDPKKGGSRTKKARGGVMRRQRYQAGGLTLPDLTGLGRLTGFQTGMSPRPGMTTGVAGVPPGPTEDTLLQESLDAMGPKPSGLVAGAMWSLQRKNIEENFRPPLSVTAPAPDRSDLGQAGGLEEIINRYETPRTSDVEPGAEWVGSEPAQPGGGGYQTPSSLLQYLEHMRAKNAERYGEPQGMQYGGTPVNWRGAPPQQMLPGPGKSVSMGQPGGMQPRQQRMQQRQRMMAQRGKQQPREQMMQAQPFPNPQQQPMMQPAVQPPMGGGMGIQAGPLPPGMGPGSGGGPMAPGGSPLDMSGQMGQLRQAMGQRGAMGPGQQPGGGRQMAQQRAQQAMGRFRGAPPQRPQAMGQPPGGGAGGGGGMPGGPRVPPNLRGTLQRQQMDNRPAPGPGGGRIGGGDQRGAMARARQSQTGRQPISRRSAFPGRPR